MLADQLNGNGLTATAFQADAEMGLRSQISGSVNIDTKEHIDRKVLRFMGDGAAYNYIAMQDGFDAIYCIVDLHAITIPQPEGRLRANTLRLGQLLLAAGLDPLGQLDLLLGVQQRDLADLLEVVLDRIRDFRIVVEIGEYNPTVTRIHHRAHVSMRLGSNVCSSTVAKAR